jgi:peptide/nickel transport system substrate-binding protein
MAKQYTEYDVKRANESLDKAFPQKNAQGQRLGPDGKPIVIIIEVSTSLPVQVDTMELVARYWKAVGIDAQVKAEDRALFETRRSANEHDAVVWQGAGGIDVVLNPPYYFPWSGRADYAQPWYVWYAKPGNPQTAAEEPPAATKQQMALYDQLVTTADQAKQGALMRQILTIAADEFYTIGISLPPNGYGIVRNNFRNVPKLIPDANTYPNPAPTNPCQYFIE